MKEIVRIILPCVTPSLNELLRMHWTEQRNFKKHFGWELVAVGAHDLKYKICEPEKRIVKIMSFRKELLDHDNLVGGAKPLVDALVDQQLLYDDNSKYVDIVYFQKAVEENPHTEIRIFEG